MWGLSQLQQTDDKHKLSCFIRMSVLFFYPILDESEAATNPRLWGPGARLNASASNFAPQCGTWWKGHQVSLAESTFSPPPVRQIRIAMEEEYQNHMISCQAKKYPGWRGWEGPMRGDTSENSAELLRVNGRKLMSAPPHQTLYNKEDSKFRQFLTVNMTYNLIMR